MMEEYGITWRERLNEVVPLQPEGAEIRDGGNNENACRSGDNSGRRPRIDAGVLVKY
jgi:hypothetical protein